MTLKGGYFMFCRMVLLILFSYSANCHASFVDSGNNFVEVDFGAFDSKMGDVDGDGDLDIALSGINGTHAARIYINDGSGNFSDSGQAIGNGTAHDLVLQDMDNDGDLDLVLCIVGNLMVFVNNGSGAFIDNGQSIATDNHYMLTAGDVDNDGDIDLIAATESTQHARLFLNDGAGALSQYGTIEAWWCHEPALGDIDGDGDLDAAFARNMVFNLLFKNTGGVFEFFSTISGGYKTQGGVYLADFDADGDLDYFEGNYSGDKSRMFFNDGNGNMTFSGQDFGTDLDDVTKVDIGDADNDGDLDLFAVTGYPTEAYYLNNGAGVLTKSESLFRGQHISLGDVDADGDLDVVFGNTLNYLYINDSALSAPNSAPIAPTGLMANKSGESITFSWQAGSDSETPEALLTYTLRVGTVLGGNDVFSGTIPAGPGNVGQARTWTLNGLVGDVYYWSVQTVDSGYQYSSWSAATCCNQPPMGGYAANHIIPVEQVTQSGDGDGVVTIRFRISDSEQDSCLLNTFEYSVDGGATYQSPINGDASGALASGWTTHQGQNYSSAMDWSGTVHSFSFDTLSPDVSGFEGVDQNDVVIRFYVNDGAQDSSLPVVSEPFRVDNATPTVTVTLGADYTTAQSIVLTLSAADALFMCFSNDGQTYSEWEAYVSSKSWMLSDGDGQKTVYVKLKDSAGNIVSTSNTILLDSTPPDAPIVIDLGTTNDDQPTLDWEVVATTRFYELEYGAQADLTSAQRVIEIGPSEYGMTNPLADGIWYWRVRAIDDYGNIGPWSAIGSFTIVTSTNCATPVSRPILISPADNASNVTLEPTLVAENFSDESNCSTHWKTHWKINDRADDFEGATTFNYISIAHSNANNENLTSLDIPAMVLEPGRTYYWKVRYHGDHGNKSEWSEVFSFTTQSDPNDSNDNGIPDSAELNDDTDLNGDGTPDKDQAGVITSVTTAKGDRKIGINVEGCDLRRIKLFDDADIADQLGKPDQMPYGLIGYHFEVPHYGETVFVKIYLHEPAPEGAKWVIHDKIEGWMDFSAHVSMNQARNKVTIELKDGGPGDEDHTENKWIVDPSGIGIYSEDEGNGTSSSGSGGSGGGCFIDFL